MRRYVHNFLATLLCVCLLISYTPLSASADEGSQSDVAPSVGPMAPVDAATGKATTTLNILAVEGLALNITPDVAASIDEIKDNPNFVLKVEVAGVKPFTYAWSRATLDADGNPGEAQPLEGATEAVYPLYQHTDTLEMDKTYRYTVQVTDATGASKEASVDVSIAAGYVEATLPDAATLPHVHGVSIHQYAVLAAAQLGDRSAAYGFLQQEAKGLKLDPSAWQLDLVGAPEGKAAYQGKLDVTLPLSAEAAAAAAAGGSVKVLGMAADGTVIAYDAVVDAGSSTATVTVDQLGVFAVAYPSAGGAYTITAVAGAGGSITPDGATAFAPGATAVYTVLPDQGFVVQSVTVDNQPVELAGNTYTFENVRADHRIEVAFAPADPPVDPEQKHAVVARVEGGNGRVALDGGSPDARVEAQVAANGSATVRFVPDDGFAIQSVTLRTGEGVAQPVNVFGSSFLIPTVTADTEVVVTYQAGIVPPTPVHEVTASASKGGSVSPERQSVPHAGAATVTVLPDEGYQLASLLVNGADAKAKLSEGGTLMLQNVVRDLQVKAVFEAIPQTYTITASATTGGSISPSGAVQVREHESATFRVKADEDYELESLKVDGQAVTATNGAYTFNDVTANHTIEATFKTSQVDPPEPTYATVTATAGPHGSVSPAGDVRVEVGSSYTFTLLPDPGYVVDQVLVDGEDASALLADDNTVTLPKVERDMALRVTFKATSVDPPVPVTYIVTASATTGGSISPAGVVKVTEGKDARFTFTADEGYHLAKIVVDGEDRPAAAAYAFENVRAAHTIHAVFEKTPVDPPAPVYVTVHVQAGEGGTISPAEDVRVLQGSSQTFTILPAEGFVIDEVTVNGQPASMTGSVLTLLNIMEETTVRATFKRTSEPVPPPVTYDITAMAGAHGSISPAGITTVVEGGSVLYTLVPDAGYHVDVLTVDGVAYPGYDKLSYRFEDVTANHSISVTFASDQDEPVQEYVTATASASPGGAISPAGEVRLPKGGTQTFFFLPEAGKRVSALTVNGKTFAFRGYSYTLFNAVTDTSIAVQFADDDPVNPTPVPATYTVSANAGEHGSVWPAGDTKVVAGGALLLTFQPDVGYEVDEVRVGGTVVQHGGVSYRLTDVAADARVDVTFAPKAKPDPDVPFVDVDVKVEVVSEGDEGGMVSPSGALSMAQGGSQTFYIFPEPGYDLEEVVANGQVVQATPLGGPQTFLYRSARAAAGAAGGYSFSVENVAEDISISVRFKKLGEGDPVPLPVVAHEVTASASSGGMISPSGATLVADGGSLSYAVKADAGWHLASLTVDGQDVADQVSGNMLVLPEVMADAVVRAVFEPDAVDPPPAPYVTVQATSTKGGTISPEGDVRVKTGESQTFAFVPDDGFVLDAVTVDGRTVLPLDGTYTLFDLAADASIHATFREKGPDDPDPVIPVLHEVTASASMGGSVQPSGVTKVAHGSPLLFTFAADEGYELDRVLLNGTDDVTDQVEDMTLRLDSVTEDCALSVSFKSTEEPPVPAASYTVTASASKGGSIDPAGAFEVRAGESVTFTMRAEEGYRFEALVVNDVDVTESVRNGSYVLDDVREDASVYARFARESAPSTVHVIEASVSGGHGSVSPEGAVRVLEGSDQEFYFFPDEGYAVDEVVVDGQRLPWSPRSYRFEEVNSDHTLSVSFKSAEAPGGGSGNPIFSLAQAALTRTGDGTGLLVTTLVAVMAGAVATSALARRRMQDRAHETFGKRRRR